MEELNNVELNETDVEVVEEANTDWKRNVLAVGLGALAVDGAVHVGAWVYKNAIEPGITKVKNAFAAKKAAQDSSDATAKKDSKSDKSN